MKPFSSLGSIVLALSYATVGVQGLFLPQLTDEQHNTVTSLDLFLSITCLFELQKPAPGVALRGHQITMLIPEVMDFFKRSADEKNKIHRYCDAPDNSYYSCTFYYSPNVSGYKLPPVKPVAFSLDVTRNKGGRSWNYDFRDARSQTTDPADPKISGDIVAGHDCDLTVR